MAEHGKLATDTDARNVVTVRATDALDRVTAVAYPDATLNTTYTYDTGAFGKGRLSGLTRQGETIVYGYDRFGRLLQDGSLTYTWDRNGNRATLTYPEAITATYGHDFADRETTLTVQVGANPLLQLVNGATYEPFGPLASLALGNGLAETRSFDISAANVSWYRHDLFRRCRPPHCKYFMEIPPAAGWSLQ